MCDSVLITLSSCEDNWASPPTTILGLAASKQADKIQMDLENFKILHSLTIYILLHLKSMQY